MNRCALVQSTGVLATIFCVALALAQVPPMGHLSRSNHAVGNVAPIFSSPIQVGDGRMAPDSSLFLPTAVYLVGGQLGWDTAIADMNHDGIPDIVEVSCCSNRTDGNGTVTVLLGNGDGTF